MRNLAISMIKFYQLTISPLTGKSCRFYPSCSCYAEEAIQQYGVLKGGYLTLIRLLKCHPFHPGGYDPVNSYNHLSGDGKTERSPTINTNHVE